MNFEEMSEGLTYAALATGKEITEERKIVYFDQLAHIDAPDFLKAIRSLVAKSDWFPSVNKILDEVKLVRSAGYETTMMKEVRKNIEYARGYQYKPTPGLSMKEEFLKLVEELEKPPTQGATDGANEIPNK